MSLSEKLATLINPAPVFKDPEEDEVNRETVARVVDFPSETPELGTTNQRSALRLKNAALLADTSSRYAGRKTTRLQQEIERNEFQSKSDELDSDEDVESSDDSDEKSDHEGGGQTSSDEDEEDRSNLEGDGSHVSDEESDESEKEESKERSESEVKRPQQPTKKLSEIPKDEGVQMFSQTQTNDLQRKGQSVLAQLKLWEALLECRIKLQKVLTSANTLPQHDVWLSFQKAGKIQLRDVYNQGNQRLKDLLNKLLELHTLLLEQNPETKSIVTGAPANSNADSDEEITSDTEDESVKDTPTSNGCLQGMKRTLETDEFPEFLKKRHQDLENYRNNNIQKWHQKTKVASGLQKKNLFADFEQSVLKQIEKILVDKDRLIRRTQLNRAHLKILGKRESPKLPKHPPEIKEFGEEDVVMESGKRKGLPLDDYDPEFFDDSDFYHNLLRELIHHKLNVCDDDAASCRRHMLEVQKLRSHVKKHVDQRASKGRKLRYDPHPKLISFMAPYDTSTMSEASRNDLFNSLFGRRPAGVSDVSKSIAAN